jgi:hypothetical protein
VCYNYNINRRNGENKENEMTQARLTAKAIRCCLKRKGIKARVKSRNYSMGSAVDIYLDDVNYATQKKVEQETQMYEYGKFDSMIDLYEVISHKLNIYKYKTI